MILGNKNLMTFIRLLLIGFFTLMSSPSYSAELIKNLGGDSGYGQLAMGRNDDGSSAAIDISSSFPNGINFFGNIYNTLYINNNGNVTFNNRLRSFTPTPFPITNRPMIAPYWGDVDTRGSNAGQPHWNNVYYAFPDEQTMIITWHMVGYFAAATNKLNDFQLVLRRRSETGVGNVDAEFRYNQLEWTTGGASGGSNGLGGTPAQVGFDAGDRINYYAHADSRTAEVLNLVNTTNAGETGVWRFLLREGEIEEPKDTLRDVVAQLFIPASSVTVDTSSFMTGPTSDLVSGDTRILTWNYDTITAGEIKDLSFDLILIDPKPDTSETVAYRFELDYVDVNNQSVHTELGKYLVNIASSRFEIGLSSNQTIYPANTDATFTASIKNIGEAESQASWSILIKDSFGALIETIVLSDISGLQSQAINVQNAVWNTRDLVAGQYIAELVAVDSVINSTVVETQPFQISPSNQAGDDQLVLSLSGSTDKFEYHTTDTVISHIDLLNESVNLTFNSASLSVSLLDPSGIEISKQSQDLYNLVPGSINQRAKIWNLDKVVEGSYQLLATVLDENKQLILSTSMSFVVKEDPLKSLTGNIESMSSNWVLGDTPECLFELLNAGTLPIDGLEYRTGLVRISTEEIIVEGDVASTSLQSSEKLNRTRKFDSGLFTVDHYACVLEQKVSNEFLLIDSAQFEIIPPPIEVVMDIQASEAGRLLVLTDEARECSALEDIQIELNWEKEITTSDQVSVRIYNDQGLLLETENITAFDIVMNSQHPIDEADAEVMVQSSGVIQISLSAPINKLGKGYRVEIEAKSGWFSKTTKDWSFTTDCDRPLTAGEIIEDVHLLGYKLFNDPSSNLKNMDPYGPAAAPTIEDQNQFIEALLKKGNIEFTLVHTAEEFTKEMRSGDYSAYLMLAERPQLSLHAQKELREHVFNGTGLLVAGAHDKRNLFIETALGLIVTGGHPWATGISDTVNGDTLFPYKDWAQSFSMLGATLHTEYTLDHDQMGNEWTSFLSSLPLFSELEEYKRHAASTYTYGQGESMFIGYDALALATEMGEGSVVANALEQGIQSVMRLNKESVSDKEQAYALTVSNMGTPVQGELVLTLPVGMEIVGRHGFTGSDSMWQVMLGLDKQESSVLNIYTRLPADQETYAISATFSANSAYGTSEFIQADYVSSIVSRDHFEGLIEIAKNVKHKYWYEPHFYVIYADLVLAQKAIENGSWVHAQTLLLSASNLLLVDQRESVFDLRFAISEQVRIIGKQL